MQFQNKAAQAVKSCQRPGVEQSSFDLDLIGDNYVDLVNENDTKQFALINADILKPKTIADTHAVVNEIKGNTEYHSIKEIIKFAIEEDFPNTKKTYKVKSARFDTTLNAENSNE